MKNPILIIALLTSLSLAAQDYHDAAAFTAHGNIKEIKTNCPGLPSILSKAKFDKEGKQVVSIFNVNMTDYDAEGFPMKIGDPNAPLCITYSFDAGHRPVIITWKAGAQSGSMSYSYSNKTSQFPESGELLVRATKKGETKESVVKYRYSNYTTDSQGNWVTRQVESDDAAHPRYIEERKLKYHK